MPVDKAGQVIAELALNDAGVNSSESNTKETGGGFYHLVNPQQNEWTALIPEIRQYLERSLGAPVLVVTLSDWVETLGQSAATLKDVPENPGSQDH